MAKLFFRLDAKNLSSLPRLLLAVLGTQEEEVYGLRILMSRAARKRDRYEPSAAELKDAWDSRNVLGVDGSVEKIERAFEQVCRRRVVFPRSFSDAVW